MNSFGELWVYNKVFMSSEFQKVRRKSEIETIGMEIMAENDPNLVKDINLQIPELERIPNMNNPKKSTLRHIRTKLPKTKNKKILKTAKEK